MTELQEVAESLAKDAPTFTTYCQCLNWVVSRMKNEGLTVLEEVAQELYLIKKAN